MTKTYNQRSRRNAFGAALSALSLFAAGCATVSSTPDAPAVSQGNRATGAKSHPQILQEFGGEVTGAPSIYVKRVGERMAGAAGLSNQCTFTVVNSEVVNAFAVPGCYIYITRGLLTIMNSEDELASVLGHEVGHITADHSTRRQNASMATTLGAVLAGVLTGSGDIANMAGQLGQVYTLGYSRDQEFQADDLGVRYLSGAGYNPYAAAEMLNELGLNDALEAKTSNRDANDTTPSWARTHPLSADRVVRAKGKAQAAGASPAQPPRMVRTYFDAINGLMVGDDPEQGFVSGQTFSHPKLKITFDAPAGFVLQNSPQAIAIAGKTGKAQFSGGKIPEAGLDGYAAQTLKAVLGQSPAQYGQRQSTTTNGLDTVIAPARAQNQSGQILDVVVYAYRVGDSAYSFITLSAAGNAQPFATMVRSFRLLSDKEAAALKGRQITIVTAGAKDTAESLSRRMAYSDFQYERFQALNGRDASSPPLKVGDLVKIVAYSK
jgi:predicted Zn-dependent protease